MTRSTRKRVKFSVQYTISTGIQFNEIQKPIYNRKEAIDTAIKLADVFGGLAQVLAIYGETSGARSYRVIYEVLNTAALLPDAEDMDA